MSVSQELFDRARKVMPGGVNSPVRAFNSVGGTPPFITAFTLLALMMSFTSLRRILVKRMGLHTWMRSITHLRPGCQ